MMRPVLPVSREWALFDAAHGRAIEQRETGKLPNNTLMQRAGEAVARLGLAIAPHAHHVSIAAGPGNNGGDALEAAVHLLQAGRDVDVVLIGDPASRPADAQAALARARAAGVRIRAHAAANGPAPQLAIDGLLGVGANRPPADVIAAAIRELNALSCPILAIDLPSGLHADTGRPLGEDCVRATHTLAMLTLKPGLFTAAGRDQAGATWLDTLGADTSVDTPQAWLSGVSAERGLPARRHVQHKGSFGDLAVVGGAPGMSGAALLAARAAHAAGAGRVHVELLEPAATRIAIDPNRPELMFRGDWSHGAPDVLARATVVCGCGGGYAVRPTLPRLLRHAARLVLDADALNVLAADGTLATLLRARARRAQATVLTPHPLEAARLLAVTAGEVQADRLRAAQELAQRFDCAVVLKGSGSVVAAPGQIPRINSTGNAALASAGTGDVLAGWIGGRWAQCPRGDEALVAFTLAIQSVAEHGAAAEPPPVSGPQGNAGPPQVSLTPTGGGRREAAAWGHSIRAADLIERLNRC